VSGMAKCDQYNEMLSAYVDGVLGRSDAKKLKKHLDSCSECRKYLALLQTIHTDLREDLPDPPETLAPGIMMKLKGENGRKKWYFGSFGRWTAIAAVLCLAVFGIVRLTGSGGGETADTVNGYRMASTAAGAPTAAGSSSGGATGGASPADNAAEEYLSGIESCSLATADATEPEPAADSAFDEGAALTEEKMPVPMPAALPAPEADTELFDTVEAPAEAAPSSVYDAASLRGYDLGRAALDEGEWYAVCICYTLPERIAPADWLPLTPGEGEIGRWSVSRETADAALNALKDAGQDAYVIGEVRAQDDKVTLA